MKNDDEVRRTVRAAKVYRPLNPEEMKEAEDLGSELVRKRDGAFLQLEAHFERDLGMA